VKVTGTYPDPSKSLTLVARVRLGFAGGPVPRISLCASYSASQLNSISGRRKMHIGVSQQFKDSPEEAVKC
jgi:hypothetical protein